MPDNTDGSDYQLETPVLRARLDAPARLPAFIRSHTAEIVGEWEAFARTLLPFSEGMSPSGLRDHIHQILAFIEADIGSTQTPGEQVRKAHGKKRTEPATAAQTHAAVRFAGGFDIGQMASEYRALRASVLKLWTRTGPAFDAKDIDDMIRFNESIDQELAESVNLYTERVAHSRELVVAMLSHDLRSPLQGITLATELSLHMGNLDEQQTMLNRKVLESTGRMGNLINTLLDVTRARFGAGLPVMRATMNMATVAEQIVDEVRVVHPRRTIELAMSGLLVGEWDKVRVGQVFSNLLNNAMQYGSHAAPVRVSLDGGPEAVTVTVANDGVPIPPEKIPKLFDPLKRIAGSEESDAEFGNLGLGLYITKAVLVAHGGAIGVSSSEAGGTVFTARFPQILHAPAQKDARQP